ncbi:hypothetical protein CHS0354_009702 [Potamilus streckersoni]|uniref:Fucolectin-related molecule n=1 Tax=Potamilus streckersoni TaxID=2493646 RepID=A0AAE0S089_9BIVA|nr:hypothetical protein CHS0354_009702 [Potamilus streckersoni]
MVNFALLKSANQSTTLSYMGFDWVAAKAVDGHQDGGNPVKSMACSATNNTVGNHTWRVDIGFQIIVKTITVYGRTDDNKHDDQLNGVNLYLGNNSGPWIGEQGISTIPLIKNAYVFKPDNIVASIISLRRTSDILTICEVTVEGECLSNSFTAFCNVTCGKCVRGQKCDTTTGMCPEGYCDPECDPGKYGYNCNETCGHCFYGSSNCSTSDGHCIDGCQAGWQCDDCKKGCETGTYGYNCNKTCGNCFYGKSNCSTSNGHCPDGCKAGWMGDDCKKECEAGKYGYNCNETCDNCFEGKRNCSTSNGHCPEGCKAGWQGDDCKRECERGTYGYRCNETCGNCFEGNISCQPTDGRCMGGCEAGWHGDICKLAFVNVERTDVDISLVGGSAGAAVAALVVVIIVIIVVKRSRKAPHSSVPKKNDLSNKNDDIVVYENPSLVNIKAQSEANADTRMASQKEAKTKKLNNEDSETYYNVGRALQMGTIPLSRFWDYVQEKFLDYKYFSDEFEELPSGPQLPITVALRPENRSKSRYKQLYPYSRCSEQFRRTNTSNGNGSISNDILSRRFK